MTESGTTNVTTPAILVHTTINDFLFDAVGDFAETLRKMHFENNDSSDSEDDYVIQEMMMNNEPAEEDPDRLSTCARFDLQRSVFT